ncbi:MAG: hypothetical protein ACTSR8_04980 [Promethearchaeota archaeon]
MPKRNSYVRIRLYDEEKENWEVFAKENNYDSISQFIRYVINEYIEHGFKKQEADTVKSIVEKAEEINSINTLVEMFMEDRKEYMNKINEILLELRRSRDVRVSSSMKGKIMKWLKKIKLSSEEIADLIQTSEPDALDILNDLVDQNLIKLREDMKYELVSNGGLK